MSSNAIFDHQRANSYIDNVYFSTQLSDIKVNTHVDVIMLSFIYPDIKHFLSAFEKCYKQISDVRSSENHNKRIRTFKCETRSIRFLYNLKIINFNDRYCLLELHQSNIDMINTVNSVLGQLGINTYVSRIELAWDFYVEDWLDLIDFFKKHLFLKYSRNKSGKCVYTYYANNIRKSVKGAKTYPKEIEGKLPVRLELTLNRRKIKDLGIKFPLKADDLLIDFGKLFDFRRFDFEKLHRSLANSIKRKIAKLNRRNSNSEDLLFRHMVSDFEDLLNIPIMEAVEKLRDKEYGISNYHRFLVPLENWNNLISESARLQGFNLK